MLPKQNGPSNFFANRITVDASQSKKYLSKDKNPSQILSNLSSKVNQQKNPSHFEKTNLTKLSREDVQNLSPIGQGNFKSPSLGQSDYLQNQEQAEYTLSDRPACSTRKD